MKRPKVRIVEIDGSIIDREMNDEEFAQFEIDMEAEKIKNEAATILAAQKAAILERLGITDEEAKLLLS